MIPPIWTGILGVVIATLTLGLSGCASNISGSDGNSDSYGSNDPIIVTVAGNGLTGFNGDGLSALETHLYYPLGMALSPDGLLYIVDWNNHRVRRINWEQTVQTVFGSGDFASGPLSEGPALEALLNHPTDIFFESNGDMLVAAWHNSQVARVQLSREVAGEIVTNSVVAGDGSRNYCCDGELAAAAWFDLPRSVLQDSIGDLIILDQHNQRIRRVDATTGVVDTICNETGSPGFSGDGGPARSAQFSVGSEAPSGYICIDAYDNIYLADTHNNRIRKIDKDGTITTVAGSEDSGPPLDGVSALETSLIHPVGVAIDSVGTLYVADEFAHTIRMVTADGIISTLAGVGEPPVDENENERFDPDEIGDGGPAREAHLNRPTGVMVSPNGDVYVADSHNHRIRRISRFRIGT